MNNKTAVTSDFGPMLITRNNNVRGAFAENGLLLGHCESTKRGWFRKKTVHRPFTLSVRETLQHVVVYAGSDSGAGRWLTEVAEQATSHFGAVLCMDFLWGKSSMDPWNACGAAIHDTLDPRVKVAKTLVGYRVFYFCTDNVTASTLANAVSRLMEHGAVDFDLVDDLGVREDMLIILNGTPEDTASMEAVTRMFAQCRASKIGLILRLHERLNTGFHAMLEANASTKVEFMPCG